MLLDLLVAQEGANSLFFCGDTAQTISRGVSFRFEDIRQLLFNAMTDQQQASRKLNPPQIQEAALRQLGINYRSHAGILEVANSVGCIKHHRLRQIYFDIKN